MVKRYLSRLKRMYQKQDTYYISLPNSIRCFQKIPIFVKFDTTFSITLHRNLSGTTLSFHWSQQFPLAVELESRRKGYLILYSLNFLYNFDLLSFNDRAAFTLLPRHCSSTLFITSFSKSFNNPVKLILSDGETE